MEIQYRIAATEDLTEICDLFNNAIDTMICNKIFQWDEIYPTEQDFREDIAKGQLYVGVAEGRIAVVYVINQDCEEQYANGNWKYTGEPYYVVHRMCVHPAFQNQGIARRTLFHIEEQLAEWGIHTIRLDAFSENPYALRLYEHMGYAKAGTADWRKGMFYLMEKHSAPL